jgi:hypothetical protein
VDGCIRENVTRFDYIVIPITLFPSAVNKLWDMEDDPQQLGHANVLILDRIRGLAVWFEPNFGKTKFQLAENELSEWCERPMTFVRTDIKLQKNDSCRSIPSYSPDDYFNMRYDDTKDFMGYCQIWCIFFTEIYLLNPQLSLIELKNYLGHLFGGMNPIIDKVDYIREYTILVIQVCNEFNKQLNKHGIPKYDIDNILVRNHVAQCVMRAAARSSMCEAMVRYLNSDEKIDVKVSGDNGMYSVKWYYKYPEYTLQSKGSENRRLANVEYKLLQLGIKRESDYVKTKEGNLDISYFVKYLSIENK